MRRRLVSCSWLQKMQVAKKVLVDGKHKPSVDGLANTFIYLQVIV